VEATKVTIRLNSRLKRRNEGRQLVGVVRGQKYILLDVTSVLINELSDDRIEFEMDKPSIKCSEFQRRSKRNEVSVHCLGIAKKG
jgi:hypothetical protein